MTKVTFIILECFRQISSLFSLNSYYDMIRLDKIKPVSDILLSHYLKGSKKQLVLEDD